MSKIKGNYIWWSAVHLAVGVLIAILGFLTTWDYVFVLGATILPLAVFHVWFQKVSKPDEREMGILYKAQANAGAITIFIIWSIFQESQSNYFSVVLWSLFVISRGAFGLYYFLKD